MALFPCNVGGGGTMSETVLWENQNPTLSFGGQDVSLNDAVDNYRYLGLYCQISTSDTTAACAFMKTSSITTYSTKIENGFLLSVLMSIGSSTTTEWCRGLEISSANRSIVHIEQCKKYTGGSGSTTNTYLIPVKIVGIR